MLIRHLKHPLNKKHLKNGGNVFIGSKAPQSDHDLFSSFLLILATPFFSTLIQHSFESRHTRRGILRREWVNSIQIISISTCWGYWEVEIKISLLPNSQGQPTLSSSNVSWALMRREYVDFEQNDIGLVGCPRALKDKVRFPSILVREGWGGCSCFNFKDPFLNMLQIRVQSA